MNLSFSRICEPSGELSQGEEMKWPSAFTPIENTSWESAP